MSSEEVKGGRPPKRDHGPQGTHVFSRDDVSRLVEQAATGTDGDPEAHLTGVSVEVKGRHFNLRGDRVILGRSENCDIILTDSSVSSEHARLTREGNAWRVANLLSTNGTFVNGKRISNQTLAHGDSLRLGRVEFLYNNARGGSGEHAEQVTPSARSSWWPVVVTAVVAAAVAVIVALMF